MVETQNNYESQQKDIVNIQFNATNEAMNESNSQEKIDRWEKVLQKFKEMEQMADSVDQSKRQAIFSKNLELGLKKPTKYRWQLESMVDELEKASNSMNKFISNNTIKQYIENIEANVNKTDSINNLNNNINKNKKDFMINADIAANTMYEIEEMMPLISSEIDSQIKAETIKELQQDNEKKDIEIRMKNLEISLLKKKNSKLEDENNELKDENSELNDEYNRLNKEIQKKEEELKMTKKEISDLNAAAKEAWEMCKALNKECEKVKQQRDKLRRELQDEREDGRSL